MQREDETYYYNLTFVQPSDPMGIQQELKFFFDDYKIKNMNASINGIVNIIKLERNVRQRVDKDEEFNDIVVDDFLIKNGLLSFKLYCGKTETKKILEKLEKLISQEASQGIKLIEKK